MVFLKYMFVFG